MNQRVKQPLTELEEFERGPEPFAGSQSSLDVAALLKVVRARAAVIFGTVVAGLALTLIALIVVVPLYAASAVLMLDQRKNAVADVNAVLSGLPTDSAAVVLNQVQILTSRQLALRVVDKLKLDRDAEFNAPGWSSLLPWAADRPVDAIKQAEAAREVAVNRLLRRVSVAQVGVSTAMTVSVASVDAAKSARITNAVAEAYIEDQLAAKLEATQKAARWLSERLRQAAAQVQSDEAAVQTYKAAHGIVDTAGGGSIVDQQTASVSVQLINAKADLAQKAALHDRVATLQRTGRAADASEVVASPLIAQLRVQESELQRQEAQLSTRYLPQHPKMVDIRSQRQDTAAKIAAEVARVIESLANDVAVGRANVGSLQGSLDRLQSKFQDQSSASVKLRALESIAASSRTMHEGLLARLKEIQGQEGIAAADARIISRATVPPNASPRPGMVLGIAIPASLVLGLVFAFLAEGLDSSFRTGEQVERYLGLPVLATVPEIAGTGTSRSASAAAFAESIRGLYLGLSLSDVDRAPRVLLVTSAVPGEGKTVIAASLARVAARSGRRVIIIDADFRRPAVAHTMRVKPAAGGIIDVLGGGMPLEQCVVRDERSNAFVLCGAQQPVNASDLVTSGAMAKLAADARGAYDLVIIDSAPLLPVHDTMAISPLADGLLFVTRGGETSRAAAVSALRSLKLANARVAGIALTRTKLDPRSYYHGYLAGSYRHAAGSLPPDACGELAPPKRVGVIGRLLHRRGRRSAVRDGGSIRSGAGHHE